MDKYIEVTIVVPIKLFIKKVRVKSEYGDMWGWESTFGIGSISKIQTFSVASPQAAADEMADRLQGVLSG